MAGSHFTGPVYSQKGFYGPTYTYATLPAASSVNPGTSYWTTDQGWYTSNGVSWVANNSLPATTPATTRIGGTRIGLIGDSLMLRGLTSTVGSSACTLSIISATEVQVTQTGHSCTVGNKVVITWADKPLLNGYCAAVLRVIDANNFTIANPGITGTYPISVGIYGVLSGVSIVGTPYQFSCNATALEVGQSITITGTNTGTGSITGYVSGNTYFVISTNGSTGFNLSATLGGAAVAVTAGTLVGLSYTNGKTEIGCWSMTNIVETGFAPWILGTQPDPSFNVYSVHALVGATSTQVNNNCVPNALKMASSPDEWWYMTGANDTSSAYSVAYTMTNVQNTMSALLATGKTIRLFTPNAYGNTGTPGTTTTGAFLQELRQQQIETYKNNPQVVIFDLSKWMIDPLSLVGNAKSPSSVPPTSTDYNQDQAHPSVTGSYQTGKNFWSDMKLAGSSLLPNISPLFPVSQMDSNAYAAGVGFSNLAKNPMLIGSAANVSGTGGSGTCAPDWALINIDCDTVVGTAQVSRSDNKPGYFNQFILTKASGNGRCRFQPATAFQSFVNSNTSSMGAGWYVFGLEVNFAVTSGTINYMALTCDYQDASGNTQIVRFLDNNGNTWIRGTTTDTLNIVSYPFYIGSNNFQSGGYFPFLEMQVGGGSSTIKIGRPFMRRINM